MLTRRGSVVRGGLRSALCNARRLAATQPPPPPPPPPTEEELADFGPPPPQNPPMTAGNYEYYRRMFDKQVERGRMSRRAADRYLVLMTKPPEEVRFVTEDLLPSALGPDHGEKMTSHQQKQASRNVMIESTNRTAEFVRRALDESDGVKKFTSEGKPSGENYWFEIGEAIGNLPMELIDEAFLEMRQERRRDSPAFDNPPQDGLKLPDDWWKSDDCTRFMEEQRAARGKGPKHGEAAAEEGADDVPPPGMRPMPAPFPSRQGF